MTGPSKAGPSKSYVKGWKHASRMFDRGLGDVARRAASGWLGSPEDEYQRGFVGYISTQDRPRRIYALHVTAPMPFES